MILSAGLQVSENANLREEYMLCIDMGMASRGPIKSLCQVSLPSRAALCRLPHIHCKANRLPGHISRALCFLYQFIKAISVTRAAIPKPMVARPDG
eukprot:scaffold557213_cov39-Prasinocladus_malaysianus.AAC.1